MQITDLKTSNFLKKPTTIPRSPALNPVSFHGVIYLEELTITAQNYSGSIEVAITGTSTLTQTLQIDSSAGYAILDISSLPVGDYTITVGTESSGTFEGGFTLSVSE
ncbi:MAG: hypothetical protein QM751_04265 [Paludibacteraceae bacterium]